MTTDKNNNSNTSREEQLATHQQKLMASFENMGLMGGTTTTAAPMSAVAPPPASAPPLPPPDSPVKHQQTLDTGTTNSSSSTMVTGGMTANNGVNHHNQQTTKEQQILTLMDSLTGSLPNVLNDDNGGGGLFGDEEDDQEDEMLFLPQQQQQPQQSYDSAFSNNLSSGTDDDQEGTLISDAAAAAAIPSQPQSFNNHRNNAPAMAPLDSSFYRNHDEALPNNTVNKHKQGNGTHVNNGQQQQRRSATQQPTPVISTTLRRDRSNSNHSLGSTTSTLTANTSYQQPLPIKQRGVNGNGNSNKQQQQPKKKKVREPFVIPDYIREFRPMWAKVTVSDPRQVSVGGINKVTNLLASVASGGMTSKFWVYTVSSTYSTGGDGGDQQGQQPSQQPQGKTIHVQRRFRHFDALQERLRDACPGAILPSRPAKHSARAIEEGTGASGGSQSTAAFVSQRAKELHNYLNALIRHPIAGNSEPLQFFLTFLDTDLGTAWPEVSNSALTRLTVGMTKTAAVATGATSGTTPSSPQHNGPSLSFDHMSGGGGQTVAAAAAARAMDDNSDLIELSTNESHRMNLIHQSIPQLESFLVKLSDYQEAQVGLAMEYTKLSKMMGNEDRPLTLSSDVISHGLLRTSRRTRRAVVEGYAALDSMLQEPRTCRMEKAAFQDRREAFVLWWNVRQQAEHKSSKVVTMRQNGIAVQLHKFEAEAAHFIQCMDEASDKVNDISVVLQSEVIRLKQQRQREWMKGLKIWTCSQKETYGELTSIWQDAKAHHERIFQSDGEEGDEENNNEGGGGDGNSAD